MPSRLNTPIYYKIRCADLAIYLSNRKVKLVVAD